MKMLLFVIFPLFLLFFTAAEGNTGFESIAFVKNLDGEVYIETATTSVRAVTNMNLKEGDTVITEEKSSVGLVFEDNTVLSLGPESKMKIETFRYQPAEKELSFIARLIRGTFSMISGQISKLAPEEVKIETPDATLGVRGTKVLVEVREHFCQRGER